MKKVIIIICLGVAFVMYLFNCYCSSNFPNPYNPFNNYGIEVGKTYHTHFVSDNPYASTYKPDTVTIKSIKGDWISFTNGESVGFGTIGMRWKGTWTEIK